MVKIIAHAGFLKNNHLPANSVPAFEAAIQRGADGIELDVHLSKDGYTFAEMD